jgi:putative DNA primase/helicase
VLPDAEVRRFVQKLVGYSLTGEIGENVLPFPYGSGANGKSVFLGVLREVLGDYATEAAPDLLVALRERGIPVDVADLRGYRFVTTTEAEGGQRMAADVMKRITGEARLKARKMRQDSESFRNVTTIWMAANDRPLADGTDEAIWRRIRLIPFTITIAPEKRDPVLAKTLLEEHDQATRRSCAASPASKRQ